MKELSNGDIKGIMLDIMNDIDSFCRENNIRYSISSGTLLGAVRHGGFIPWDDDADIFMPREDFDRFVKSYKGRKYYTVYEPDGDKKFVVSGYAKVCDPGTRINNNWYDANHGVYVDVFPLDYVPAEKKEREKRMKQLMRFTNRMYHRGKNDFLSIIKAHGRSMHGWWKKCDSMVHDDRYGNTGLVAHALGAHNFRTVLETSRFDHREEIEFEGRKFLCVENPRQYLAMVYGDDYMTPPPPEKRESHGDRFIYIV